MKSDFEDVALASTQFASKSTGNAALGFGVAGTILGLLGTGIAGGALGRGTGRGYNFDHYPHCGGAVLTEGLHCPTAFQVEKKECEDVLKLTRDQGKMECEIQKQIGDLAFEIERVVASNTLAYERQRFEDYKSIRDKFDQVNERVAKVEQETAISTAVRPYQDKILKDHADLGDERVRNWVERHLCLVPKGIPCLPNETVTGIGYSSALCGNCQ